MDNLHLVYTSYGDEFGWSISSPQIPELIGGRNTIDELIRDTDSILEFAKIGPYEHLYRHEQIAAEDPHGNEYLIRWLSEEDGPEFSQDDPMSRLSTAGRLFASVRNGYSEHLRNRQPLLVTGERLLIAVLGDDTIGFVFDQLDTDQGAVIAQHRGEDAVYSVPLGIPHDANGWTWRLEDLGLTRDASVETVIDRALDWEANKLGAQPEASLVLPRAELPYGKVLHLP